MHSYKSLAVFALAVSTASTAYSAPLQESQQQARSEIGGPLNVDRDLAGRFNLSTIFDRKRPYTVFGGRDTRDTVDLNQRASASGLLNGLAHSDLLKTVGTSVAGGTAATLAGLLVNKVLNHTGRGLPPIRTCWGLSEEKTARCKASSEKTLLEAATRDVVDDALQILKRQLIELEELD